MATQKPVEWVNSLMTRFEEQLPCRSGPQTTHSRINVEQNKESLINISKYRFSLVIAGLTKILHSVNEMRLHSQFQPEFEKNFYESQLIVLDTLERCLSGFMPRHTKKNLRYKFAMCNNCVCDPWMAEHSLSFPPAASARYVALLGC
ncbi:neurofibromin [Nephila pilipes]|uniref:Neurofibromin n=1 Tax=Nephila pilipes TaxID=299642 RepID=A0A8X6QU18_NEPPI|nr:neurofibromin [Nephila pilipes]